MYISPGVSTGHWFHGVILALKIFLPPLLHRSPSLEGKDLMKTFFNEELGVSKSLIFYTLSNYESLCTVENSLPREWWACLPNSVKLKKLIPHRHLTGQSNLDNPLWRLPSQITLDCAKLVIKSACYTKQPFCTKENR